MIELPSARAASLKQNCNLIEEIANSITHGLGALLSVAGLTILVTYAAWQNDVWRIVSFSVYGTSLILLFLSSTIYHGLLHCRAKQAFKLLDHCAIYLLIAGTYTPFLLVSIRGTTGWILFTIIWLMALFGIACRLIFPDRFRKMSIAAYIFMGWLAIIVSNELITSLSINGMAWLLAGGIIYTLGVLFYIWKQLPFNHAIWHLFVLGGSICHFFAVFLYVLPTTP
ncbi:MAG: hemolysin III family protein [Candidatus Endonucleobacter sp. (ex Gigantidas childressi)]|nr:hemolysin III family protein [Candidatus Endonucleobacter sp. (ex Gigantidas childressi)]